MDLKCFDVVKNVVVSTKSKLFYDKSDVITFVVGIEYNKVEIKKAVEQIWTVKVSAVRTLIVKGCQKKFSGKKFVTGDYKKAFVKLAPGYKIDLPWDGIVTSNPESRYKSDKYTGGTV